MGFNSAFKGLNEKALFVCYIVVQGTVNEFDVLMVVTMWYRVLQCDAVLSDGYLRTLRSNLPPYSGWKTRRNSVISCRI